MRRKSHMMITFLDKPLLVLFCLATTIMEPSCLRDSYEVRLSGPVTVGSEWIEFHPRPSLKAEKDLQMILLELDPPFKDDFYKEGSGPNKGSGILMPDRDVINPEIQVVDQSGNEYNLIYAGSRRTFWPVYNLPHPNNWPRDREYTTVRIRSPRSFKCKAIYWYCESAKDLR
jgi:hypothetical protein